jgi:hypothetical protein
MGSNTPKPLIAQTASQSCGHLSACVGELLGEDPDIYREHFKTLPNEGVVTETTTRNELLEIIRQNIEFLIERIRARTHGPKTGRPTPSVN